MSDIVFADNIGALAVVVGGLHPQSASAGTLNSGSIDREAHHIPLSCIVYQDVGATTGSPTSFTVQTTVQHSADNSTWAAYAPANANSVTQQTSSITTASTATSVGVDLSSANRYIRLQTVVTFSGGTSPTIPVATSVLLGGESLLPAV